MEDNKTIADNEVTEQTLATPEPVNYVRPPTTKDEIDLAHKIQSAEMDIYEQKFDDELERINRIDSIAASLKGGNPQGYASLMTQLMLDKHHKDIESMKTQMLKQIEQGNADAAAVLGDRIFNGEPPAANMYNADKAVISAAVAQNSDSLADRTPQEYDKIVQEQVDKGLSAQILNRKLAEIESGLWQEAGTWGIVSAIGQQLIPVPHLRTAIVNNIEEMLGRDLPMFAKEKAMNALLFALVASPPEEQDAMLKQIAEWKLSAFGAVQSTAATAYFFTELRKLTSGEANLNLALDLVDITVVADIMYAFNAVRKAGKLRSIEKNLGKHAELGKKIYDRLKAGRESDVDVSKDIASATTTGKSPWALDQEIISGVAPHIQEQLTSALRELYQATEATAKSTGISRADLKAALDALRSKYDPAVNKAVHSVVLGDATEEGVPSTIFWQNSEGKYFRTKDEAIQFAQRNGMTEYEIIPPNYKGKVVTFETSGGDGGGIRVPKAIVDIIEDRISNEFDFAKQKAAGLGQKAVVKIRAGNPEFNTKLLQLTKELQDLVGLEGRVFVADFDWMRQQEGFSEYMKTVKSNVDGFRGTIKLRGGEQAHLIGLNIKPTSQLQEVVGNYAHEFAHAIDRELLESNPVKNDEIFAEFQRFLEFVDYLEGREFAQWLAKRNFATDKKTAELIMVFNEQGSTIGELGEHAKWQVSFKEWKADQIAKFLFTDTRPKSIADKYFKGVADALKAIAQWLARQLGMSAIEVTQPNKVIRGWLATHLNRVRQGQPVHSWGTFGPDEMLYSVKIPGKPNIKLKSKQVDEVTKEEASSGAGYLVKETRNNVLQYGDISKFSPEDVASANQTIAIDPRSGVSLDVMAGRQIAAYTGDKLKNDIQKFISSVAKGTTAEGRAKVEGILKRGNVYAEANGRTVGHEFSWEELKQQGLTDPEATLYMGIRQLRMFMYQKRNAEAVRHLQAGGWKKLIFKNLGEDKDQFIGRELKNIHELPKVGTLVYDSRYKLAEAVVTDLYDDIAAGKAVVYKLRRPHEFKKGSGEMFTYVVGSPENSQFRDITTVIPYRPGEYSRIYTDEYFIDEIGDVLVDGVQQRSTRIATTRTASNVKDAKEYVAAMNKAIQYVRGTDATSEGVSIIDDTRIQEWVGKWMSSTDFLKAYVDRGWNSKRFDYHYDRSVEQYLSSTIDEQIDMERTFTSPRGEKLLPVDNVDRENTYDVWQSIQAEATNTTRLMTSSQWRETSIAKWMNTYRDQIPRSMVVEGDDTSTFFNLEGFKWDHRDSNTLFAERTHKYILRQIGVRNAEERFFESVTRHLTEKYLPSAGPLSNIGARIRRMDGFGFARNINFNVSLGFWNLAQILVQGNGAITAVAVSPVHGMKAASTFPLLRVALMSDREDVWRQIAKVEKYKNLGFSSEDEFVDLVKAVNKTGILSNLSSTAYWTREGGAVDMFKSYPKKFWQTNTAFFNRGEEFSRLVSFDVARREWIKKNPKLDWRTDKALEEIITRMDDLTVNMTKANMARWQQGVLSIPMQFLQYNLKIANKFMTSMVKGGNGRGFTRPEAIRLLTMHLALYGAAGNGLTWLVDELMPEEQKRSLTTEQKAYINQGLISGLIASITKNLPEGDETHLAVGSRLGVGEWYYRVGKAAYSGDTTIYEVGLGPTFGLVDRLGTAAQVARVWYRDPDLTAEDVLEGLALMGSEVIGSVRNATKAWMYYNHEQKFLNRYNVPLTDINKTEALAKALGIQPTQIVDLFHLYDNQRAHDETMKEIAELVYKYHQEYLADVARGDMKEAEEKMQKVQAMWPANAGEAWRVRNYILKNLFPYDDKFHQMLGEHFWRPDKFDKGLLTTEEPTNGQ